MPKLAASGATHTLAGTHFTYQAARIGDLGATEYTLVNVAIDLSGSVAGFDTELRDMLVTIVEACKKSPRSDNLLLRVVLFSTSYHGLEELHGYVPLNQIDTATYPTFRPGGGTPLTDAAFSAVGSTVQYGGDLTDNDFLANGIVFVITDGDDNYSTATTTMVKREIEKARAAEKLESLVGILIGINAAQYKSELEQFKLETGFDKYIDAGDVTPQKLAKLAAFVSQSVSSQSQALGTGGPSQTISATI